MKKKLAATKEVPKPDMLKSVKEEVFNDLTNLLDDVDNCFDVDEDISREQIQQMVKEAIEKSVKDVVATLAYSQPDTDELVKDMDYVEDVLTAFMVLGEKRHFRKCNEYDKGVGRAKWRLRNN